MLVVIHRGPNGLPEGISPVMAGTAENLTVGQGTTGGSRTTARTSQAESQPCGFTGDGPSGSFSLKPSLDDGITVTIGATIFTLHPLQYPAPKLTGNAVSDYAAIAGTMAVNIGLNVAPLTGQYNRFISVANTIASIPEIDDSAHEAGVFVSKLITECVLPAVVKSTGELAGYHGRLNEFALEAIGEVPGVGLGLNGPEAANPTGTGDPCAAQPQQSFTQVTSFNTSASIYQDPSGRVTTRRHVPLAGARVVLLHSATANGRLTAVPDGSEIMSPPNRRNPDRTDASGQFGWDVLSGRYRVTAQHPSCTASRGRRIAETPIFPVPPPVADLTLTLDCPHLTRAVTRTTLHVTIDSRSPAVTLESRVTARSRHTRGRATGTVTFTAGPRRLGAVPMDSSTGLATLTANAASGRSQYRASYSGDANYGPSEVAVGGKPGPANHAAR